MRRFLTAKLLLALPVLLLLLVVPQGCGPAGSGSGAGGHGGTVDSTIGTTQQTFRRDPEKTGPITVTCTTGMIADIVRQIGEDRTTVVQLMGTGVDPHQYKATEADVRALGDAEVIFYNGLMLEGKMEQLFEQMAKKKLTVPVATIAVPHDKLRMVGGENHPDPHVWFDVSLWRACAKLMCEALANYDNINAEKFRYAWRRVDSALDMLHQATVQNIARIPESQRVLVTAHDAFGYFGRAYNIEVRAIQGISTEDEAGIAATNQLKQFIVDRKVKAVFVESTINKRSIEALIEGCRAMDHEVVEGGLLYSDAMGAPDTEDGTYVGMVRHNVQTIVNALR